ncbi:MAG: hypothetical protein WBO15_01915, partial [Gammaproteobacteria bacterium]
MKISRRRSGRHASFAAVAAAILMTVAAAASAASEPAASGVRILNHENLVQISEFSRAGADTTGLQQKALVERLSFQAFGREFAVTLQD